MPSHKAECLQETAQSSQRHAAAPVRTRRGVILVHNALNLCLDVIGLFVSQSIAIMLCRRWLGLNALEMDSLQQTMIFTLFVIGVIYLFDGYSAGKLRRPENELECICKAVTAAFVTLFLAEVLTLRGVPHLGYRTSVWYLIGLLMVLTGRFAARTLRARLWTAGHARRRAVLVGSRAGFLDYKDHFSIQHFQEYEIVAFVDCSDGLVEGWGAHERGRSGHWRELADRMDADVVVINLQQWPASNSLKSEIAYECRDIGIEIEFCSPLFQTNRFSFDIDKCTGSLRMRSNSRLSFHIQLACKALLDLVIGLVGSAVTLLIVPVIWVLLKLEDGGPLFHRREFVGCDGKVHYYLKFRTMVQNADSILRENPDLRHRFADNHKLKDDPRILRIGRILRRFSIDEFPQFLSVLTRQLTFVGPRVISLAETKRYGAYLDKRMSVKPGLTGYWQVMGRQTTTYHERILMDMFYVEQWSIWLDLIIIGKTFCGFFSPEGAY